MRSSRVVIPALLALACACATPSRASVPGPAPREGVSDGRESEPLPESEAERARVEENCPSGEPRVDRPNQLGALRIVARDGYALVHSSTLRVPLFVCEHVTVEELSGSLHGHRPHWQADPSLPADERAEDADYRNSGYDRGHMAPLADQTADERARHETFYFSNAVPQDRAMNEGVWNALEQEVRDVLRTRGGGYVITGPIFESRDGEPRATIGASHVAVPTSLYKIVVVRGTSGSLEAFAFVYENRAYPAHEPRNEHLVPIDDVERRTGLDFLPDLDDDVESALESTTATTFAP